MVEILTVILVIAAVGLIGLVLIQHGKGADMGASFGAGASQTVFGSSGSGNFLTRTTSILALVFFVCSLALAHLSARKTKVEDSLLLGPVASESKPAANSDIPVTAKPAANSELPVAAPAAKAVESEPAPAAVAPAVKAVEATEKSSEKTDKN